MKTQVTFRHFNGHHPQLHHAAEELAASFTKYSDGIISTNIELINDGEKIVNFIVHMKEHTITSEFTSDDFHRSLNAAAEKIIKQIQKHKEKKIASKSKVRLKEAIKESPGDNYSNDYDEE
jgi:ribosomal subunit interface protein